MRIALLIEHLDHRRGGAETWIHQFSAYLAARGHDVTIVTQDDAHDPPAGVAICAVQPRGLTRGARDRDFGRLCIEALAELRPDVSMATGKALGADVYQPHGGTVRGSQRQNIALLGSYNARALKMLFNRLSPKHRDALALEAKQYGDGGGDANRRYIAISRMVQRDMRTFYRVSPDQVRLIYNGVDLARFSPERLAALRDESRARFGLAAGDQALLFVAHNFKLKGLGELIAAVGLLIKNGRWPTSARLLVVGRGRAGRYRRQAERVDAAQAVRFIGPVSPVDAAYAAADAFVHPTWYDPCSLVALEALAAGLPVLTTRFNGVSELMEGREAGVLLDSPRPVRRLAEGLEALLDGASRGTMSAAARGVAEEYPLEENFRHTLEYLEQVAGERTKRQ